MVIQDDAIISDGLVESVERAVVYSGDHPVGLYAGAGKITKGALELGAKAWWLGKGPTWGVAVVIPVDHVQALVRFGDRYRSRSYDQRLWHFYQSKTDCWYTVPSLVDHRIGHGSLLGKGRDRRAERFGSGLDVDWSTEPVVANRQTIFPVIEMTKNGQRKRVRKGTRFHQRMVQQGWR